MMEKDYNKVVAVDFLKLIVAGNIDQAYEKYVDMDGRHHNAFCSAGFLALKQAMKDNDRQFPDKSIVIKNVVGEGGLVVVHSHLTLKAGDPGIITVHLLRFDKGKMVEMWDCGQAVPVGMPNKDGLL